jgi:hypothetical protein
LFKTISDKLQRMPAAGFGPMGVSAYQNTTGGSGPPFSPTSAVNGLSVNGAGQIVLGNDAGGISATLLNNREIPTAGFNTLFSGAGSVTIGTSVLNGTATAGLFSGLPKLSLSGARPTMDLNIDDFGTISGVPWGTSSFVFRSSSPFAPYLGPANFGANVTAAMNYHYASTGSALPSGYTSAIEFSMGQNDGTDSLPLSIYGKGNHFAGTYLVPTVNVSDCLTSGWANGFAGGNYLLLTPQVTLRGAGGKNTQLELSNAGASTANNENAIFFSVDNAPLFVASSYPSTKTVFVTKSTTNAAGTKIQSYLATTNAVQGGGLVGQEFLSFFPESQTNYLPAVSANYRMNIGVYLTNDGLQNSSVTSLYIDAFANPIFIRNLPTSGATVNNFLVVDNATFKATQTNIIQVNTGTGIAINGNATIAGNEIVNGSGGITVNSDGFTGGVKINSTGTAANSDASLALTNNIGTIGQLFLTASTNTGIAGADALGFYSNGAGGIKIFAQNATGTILFSTGAAPTTAMTIKANQTINMSNLQIFATNALALAGGLVAGDLYRNAAGVVSITF